jgi:tetraprenyl-beta-curcumene synthase
MAWVVREAAGIAASAGRRWLRGIGLVGGFLAVARRYWLSVYPVIQRELRQWRARAGAIPDPVLRRLAFEAHCGKRGNLEGAAAFAVFVPWRFSLQVTRALVAFQGAYDYVDVLSEQGSEDTVASGYRLHLTLIAALTPGGGRPHGYAHHPVSEDAGYLQALIEACRVAVACLPSYGASAACAREGARRIAVYQGLNNWGAGGGPEEYARWAAEETPSRSGLSWWETGAAAGSSLSVFAAIAAAADALVGPVEAAAIDAAYFPWIGALHTLLDSLVDRPADVAASHHSLVSHYGDPERTALRMQEIAEVSMRRISALPKPRAHAMLLAAMSCFYLVAPEASLPHAAPARADILAAIGELALPTMLVMRLRQILHGRASSTAAQRLAGACEGGEEART